jgi:hypothetical protein
MGAGASKDAALLERVVEESTGDPEEVALVVREAVLQRLALEVMQGVAVEEKQADPVELAVESGDAEELPLVLKEAVHRGLALGL